ncbi:FAD-dependent monooxygenase [Chitinophaga silvatica]|uniref:Flavin-dependent monooxygenase n=1 Tax=Chitinophaga silvatica TaxID=2282649 RepID=A0A3E1Y956_9BACT|nr:NAD(P)/FAD-dependent oxidoreductase [Chitinophaga silvatica]RFS21920.1 FAD-dependent monooxygenase [Chitinophaga silvatica]
MKLITDKTIAIVGGGPGGLTLARLLQMKGAKVKVFERDEYRHVRVQGATLDLHEESGLAALEAAGLMNAFKENYRPGADYIRIADQNATIIYDEHQTIKETDRPEIDRGPLRTILLDSLSSDSVVWDSYLINLQPHGESWELQFKNGNKEIADIVIAADGANSKIRPAITSITPVYSGVTIIEGSVYNAADTIPEINDLVKGGKVFAMGNEQTLIISSKGDGSLTYYIGFNARADWHLKSCPDLSDNQAVSTWFKTHFPTWSEFWLPLFEHAATPFVVRPLMGMPTDQTWETANNLTMLGDAAHLMPPYAGEGVNMAMQDALELSNCLTNDQFTSVHAALKYYEEKMLERTREIAQISVDQTIALHSKGAIEHMMGIIS